MSDSGSEDAWAMALNVDVSVAGNVFAIPNLAIALRLFRELCCERVLVFVYEYYEVPRIDLGREDLTRLSIRAGIGPSIKVFNSSEASMTLLRKL
jgi:hypothetical protein